MPVIILIVRTHDLLIPHLISPALYKLQVLLNQLCETFCLQSGSSDLFFLHLKSPVFSSWRFYKGNIYFKMMLNKIIIQHSIFGLYNMKYSTKTKGIIIDLVTSIGSC